MSKRILIEDLTDDQLSYYVSKVLGGEPRSKKLLQATKGMDFSDSRGRALINWRKHDRLNSLLKYYYNSMVFDQGNPGTWTVTVDTDDKAIGVIKSSSDTDLKRAMIKVFLKVYFKESQTDDSVEDV